MTKHAPPTIQQATNLVDTLCFINIWLISLYFSIQFLEFLDCFFESLSSNRNICNFFVLCLNVGSNGIGLFGKFDTQFFIGWKTLRLQFMQICSHVLNEPMTRNAKVLSGQIATHAGSSTGFAVRVAEVVNKKYII